MYFVWFHHLHLYHIYKHYKNDSIETNKIIHSSWLEAEENARIIRVERRTQNTKEVITTLDVDLDHT